MKTVCMCLALVLPLETLAAEPVERLTLRTLHLRPAGDITMTYRATCDGVAYALVALMSPAQRRATSITAQLGEGAQPRQVDVTPTELGQLMVDRQGVGELGFGCGADGLYVRYLGATRADDTAPAVVQDALFRLSREGALVRLPPAGISLTTLR